MVGSTCLDDGSVGQGGGRDDPRRPERAAVADGGVRIRELQRGAEERALADRQLDLLEPEYPPRPFSRQPCAVGDDPRLLDEIADAGRRAEAEVEEEVRQCRLVLLVYGERRAACTWCCS